MEFINDLQRVLLTQEFSCASIRRGHTAISLANRQLYALLWITVFHFLTSHLQLPQLPAQGGCDTEQLPEFSLITHLRTGQCRISEDKEHQQQLSQSLTVGEGSIVAQY